MHTLSGDPETDPEHERMADLTALALNATDTLSVWELHGVVCGLAIWQEHSFQLTELLDLVGVDALRDEISVEAFIDASIDALMDQEMSFMPLLPEDDAEFAIRLEALAEWCAGFLAGFGAAGTVRGLSSLETLPAEIQEIVGDLSAITDVDVSTFDSPDSDTDLMQIQEFVKVAVMLILAMINEPPDDSPDELAQ